MAFFTLAVFFSATFFTVADFVAAGARLTFGAFFVVVFEVGGAAAPALLPTPAVTPPM